MTLHSARTPATLDEIRPTVYDSKQEFRSKFVALIVYAAGDRGLDAAEVDAAFDELSELEVAAALYPMVRSGELAVAFDPETGDLRFRTWEAFETGEGVAS